MNKIIATLIILTFLLSLVIFIKDVVNPHKEMVKEMRTFKLQNYFPFNTLEPLITQECIFSEGIYVSPINWVHLKSGYRSAKYYCMVNRERWVFFK